MSVHDIIREHLLTNDALKEIRRSQWSADFASKMLARLVQGYFRYGEVRNQIRYDSVGSAIKHLNAYLETGNQEHLVDAANFCMIEYIRKSCHPSPYFETIQREEYHVPCSD